MVNEKYFVYFILLLYYEYTKFIVSITDHYIYKLVWFSITLIVFTSILDILFIVLQQIADMLNIYIYINIHRLWEIELKYLHQIINYKYFLI